MRDISQLQKSTEDSMSVEKIRASVGMELKERRKFDLGRDNKQGPCINIPFDTKTYTKAARTKEQTNMPSYQTRRRKKKGTLKVARVNKY